MVDVSPLGSMSDLYRLINTLRSIKVMEDQLNMLTVVQNNSRYS